jgi:hypothetical protein
MAIAPVGIAGVSTARHGGKISFTMEEVRDT